MNIRAFEDKRPEIDASVYVDPSAVVIGDVTLEAESSVWPQCTLRGDVHRIHVGARTNIQDNSVLHVTNDGPYTPGGHPLEIGEEVTIGHRVVLHGCRVGDRCLVGMGALVLDGAVLEPEVLLGAGSLVPPGRVLRGGYLWLGNPVRRVRPLTVDELDWLHQSAGHYAHLAARHRLSADA